MTQLAQYSPAEIIAVDTTPVDRDVTCASCHACCCRLEVMIISDTGVPERYIDTDEWGGQVMARLDDGWCAALNRDTLMCGIYEQRPWICRELQTGSDECLTERQTMLLKR